MTSVQQNNINQHQPTQKIRKAPDSTFHDASDEPCTRLESRLEFHSAFHFECHSEQLGASATVLTTAFVLTAVLLLSALRAQADPLDKSVSHAYGTHNKYNKYNEIQCTLVPSMLEQAERLADSLATPSIASTGRSAQTIARIDSLAQIATTAHHISLGCGYRLTSMMSKAAANAAANLRAAQNVLLFRMGVRDTKAFLREARTYYDQERQVR